MNIPSPSRVFVADPAGFIGVVPRDDPRNIDLSPTEPIDIPMGSQHSTPITDE